MVADKKILSHLERLHVRREQQRRSNKFSWVIMGLSALSVILMLVAVIRLPIHVVHPILPIVIGIISVILLTVFITRPSRRMLDEFQVSNTCAMDQFIDHLTMLSTQEFEDRKLLAISSLIIAANGVEKTRFLVSSLDELARNMINEQRSHTLSYEGRANVRLVTIQLADCLHTALVHHNSRCVELKRQRDEAIARLRNSEVS